MGAAGILRLIAALLVIFSINQCAMIQQIIEKKFTERLYRIHSPNSDIVTEAITMAAEIVDRAPTSITATTPDPSKPTLNYDNYLSICSLLDVRSMINLAQTCKDAAKAVRDSSFLRVSATNPLFAFEESSWINLLILAVIYEFDLPDKFVLDGGALMHDQLHLLLFKFLHTSHPQSPIHPAAISFIYKCGYGLDTSVPGTQKQWRLSLIRLVYHSHSLTSTISALKRHYESVPPSFTENFVDWLDFLELFAMNPSKTDLIRLRNINYSANHYLHDELEEDFREIIEEVLQT